MDDWFNCVKSEGFGHQGADAHTVQAGNAVNGLKKGSGLVKGGKN